MSAVVLIVEDDLPMRDALVRILTRYGSLRIETADDGPSGFAAAQRWNPDLIVSDYEMPGWNGFELCRRVKADPELQHAMFVVLTGHTDNDLKIAGLNLGVDDYLTKPVEAAEFLAKIRAVLRIKELHNRIIDEREELRRLHARLEGSFDHLVGTLIHILGLRIPGAAERGEHLSKHALTIAERMDVPEEYFSDLDRSARLHEIGKLVHRAPPGPNDPWNYLLASDLVLREVDELTSVADLVLAMGEHWDGSGQPRHLLQGQIPLRSRILRTLIDLFTLSADPNHPAESSFEHLNRHAGTFYDPLVVTHVVNEFGSQPSQQWMPDKRCIPLGDLSEGMILAKDLVTGSGIKLLTTGATVTDNTLDLILQRHAHDPILYGAWIQQRS